jgi:circadian clock protein KaiC
MERVATGIKGFDNLIEGGFPKGSAILLSGTPATGKTIFALQYLVNGAKDFNENSLYITFEEKRDNLKMQAKQFGWNLEELEKKNKLIIKQISPNEISKNTIKEIIELAKECDIKRIAIDSLSTLSINTPSTYMNVNEMNEYTIKRFIYSFIDELKQSDGITSILISQSLNDEDLSRDDVSEFICDGIIHLTFESMGGQFSRSLLVRKMRRTKNDEDIHPLEIGKSGIAVHNIK